MGLSGARPVVGTVPGTVPGEGERPPWRAGVAPPSRVQSRAWSRQDSSTIRITAWATNVHMNEQCMCTARASA